MGCHCGSCHTVAELFHLCANTEQPEDMPLKEELQQKYRPGCGETQTKQGCLPASVVLQRPQEKVLKVGR